MEVNLKYYQDMIKLMEDENNNINLENEQLKSEMEK